MPKAIARPKKRETVNTEDAILARLDSVAVWIRSHTRAASIAAIVLVGLVAASIYYKRYRAGVEEQAAVQLTQLRLAAVSENPDAVRTAINGFLTQFGSSREAADARLLLAELELRRDSVDAAIAALEPAAETSVASPVGYAVASMLAAAYEQAGRPEEAIRQFETIAAGAPYDFQRTEALSEEARLLVEQGRYAEAEAILAELAASSGDEAVQGNVFRERLGEVRALVAASAP